MLKGTIINAVLIVIGSLLGLIFGGRIKEKVQQTVFAGCGLFVIYVSITGFKGDVSILNVILSLCLGGFVGELLDLDGLVKKFAKCVETKLAKKENSFSKGFINATLLFLVGSMAIVGSIQSGLENNHTTLITKGVIDGVTSIFMIISDGIGVLFSAIAVLLYQGAITIFASFFANILTESCLTHISVVGSIILLSVAFNMLKIKEFKSMNYIPAIIFTIIFVYLGI